MDGRREDGDSPQLDRERLLALERRVGELERAAERQLRRRGRWRLYILVSIALYLVLLWWEMKKLG